MSSKIIFIAEMIEANLGAVPTGLAAQLLEHKSLNKMPVGLTIMDEVLRIEPKQ
jgi:hypothetical protein